LPSGRSRSRRHVFLDVDELQVGRFDEKLLQRIESTANFVLILTGRCLDRCTAKNDWLKREIVHAIETKRNMIPVLVDDFLFPDEGIFRDLPDAMRILPNLQGVNYRHVHRDSAVQKIAEYLREIAPFERPQSIGAVASAGITEAASHGPDAHNQGKIATLDLTFERAWDLDRGGDLDGAMTLYKEAEILSRELGNKDGLLNSLDDQAKILKDRGDLDGAMAHFIKEERLLRDLGEPEGVSVARGMQKLLALDEPRLRRLRRRILIGIRIRRFLWLNLLNVAVSATLLFGRFARPSLAVLALFFATSPFKAAVHLWHRDWLYAMSTSLVAAGAFVLLFLLEPTARPWWVSTAIALIGGGLLSMGLRVALRRCRWINRASLRDR